MRSRYAPDARADIQLHFLPAMLDNHGRHRLRRRRLHHARLLPASAQPRPHLSLASDRAADKPRIEANYLGDAEGFDLKMMVECAKLSRELLAQPAFDAFRGAPIFPARDDLDDAGLVEFVRAKAETIYHPIGTCRMGSDDALGGGSAIARARRGRPARDRRLGDADPDRRQYQCADDHDRRTRRGPDSCRLIRVLAG